MAAPKTNRDNDQLETRHLILRAAANLFADYGYAATTTREIAATVGIKQPSLFYHFSSKQEILDQLLQVSIEKPATNLKALLRAEGSPAQRLMCHLFLDAHHILSCPYNLLGLHADDVLLAEFKHWQAELDRLHHGIRSLVRDAVAVGEFIAVKPTFAQWMLTGGTLAIIRTHGGVVRRRPDRMAWEASRLLTRMYLAQPELLDDYQRAAEAIAARICVQHATPSATAKAKRFKKAIS